MKLFRFLRFTFGLALMASLASATKAQTSFISVSAASYDGATLAPESIVAGFGSALANATQAATTVPLPTTLAGTTVKVRDGAGIERDAPLFFVSPGQVNYLMPPNTATGEATVTVRNASGATAAGKVNVAAIAPGLFAVDASGKGWPAALLLRVKADGAQSYEALARYDAANNRFAAVPVEFGADSDQLFLILYGTGLRGAKELATLSASIGGVSSEVLAIGAQGQFAGLDQVNLRLPRATVGRGEIEIALSVESKAANPLRIAVGAIRAASLFVANLRPEGSAVSSGSGVSTLRLSADEKSAVVRFAYSNLTTAQTSAHLHGPADAGANASVLFDFDETPKQLNGSYLWTFTTVGGVTPAQIVSALKTGRLYLNIHSARYPTGEIRGHYGLISGSTTFTPPPVPPPLPNATPSLREAARFLTQATYGPTWSEINALPSQGYAAWIESQFNQPHLSNLAHLAHLDALTARGVAIHSSDLMESIWQQAVSGEDQLRQRVALALSEIMVVSETRDSVYDNAEGFAAYLDLLGRNAFGNFRTLLEEMTLSPLMGRYLDHLANDKEDPDYGTIPNENFAREVLQLFSVGLYRLHPDGTLQLDANGLPQATYTQETVTGFSQVFTGWLWGANDVTNPSVWYDPRPHWRVPMACFQFHHSPGAKRLLNGMTLPANQPCMKDLQDALDNIFQHPNVGPFIARQLIQRLVTSNPSPAYVYRVAAQFNDNGRGVRGDLKAVLRAVLLDYEARSATLLNQQGYGKQREPWVRLATLLRVFKARAPGGRLPLHNLQHKLFALGQNIFRAPSVFNFFMPDYRYPGALAQAGLYAPEFQISNEMTVIARANLFHDLIYEGYRQGDERIMLDFSELTPLAVTPAALIDRLDVMLLSGAMSQGWRASLVKAVTALPQDNPAERVKAAVYLIALSPEFVIQK